MRQILGRGMRTYLQHIERTGTLPLWTPRGTFWMGKDREGEDMWGRVRLYGATPVVYPYVWAIAFQQHWFGYWTLTRPGRHILDCLEREHINGAG